jgi:NAD(P)-dependent dehydrogenase (short-subunit alcohol dehydrogenase family)
LDSGAQDKFALVTGGNRRIGKAVAWQLAKEDVGRNRLQAYERSGREVITARVIITDGILAYIPSPQKSECAVPLLRLIFVARV